MQGPFDFNSREIIDSSDIVTTAACAFAGEDASRRNRQVAFVAHTCTMASVHSLPENTAPSMLAR